MSMLFIKRWGPAIVITSLSACLFACGGSISVSGSAGAEVTPASTGAPECASPRNEPANKKTIEYLRWMELEQCDSPHAPGGGEELLNICEGIKHSETVGDYNYPGQVKLLCDQYDVKDL